MNKLIGFAEGQSLYMDDIDPYIITVGQIDLIKRADTNRTYYEYKVSVYSSHGKLLAIVNELGYVLINLNLVKDIFLAYLPSYFFVSRIIIDNNSYHLVSLK